MVRNCSVRIAIVTLFPLLKPLHSKLLAPIAVGERPFGVSIDASGQRAFTANVKSNDVSIIDLSDGKAIANVKVGRRPYAVGLAQGKAFVTDQYAGTVSVIDVAKAKVIKKIEVGGYPEGVAADPGGRFVYVACWDDSTLERIDGVLTCR